MFDVLERVYETEDCFRGERVLVLECDLHPHKSTFCPMSGSDIVAKNEALSLWYYLASQATQETGKWLS